MKKVRLIGILIGSVLLGSVLAGCVLPKPDDLPLLGLHGTMGLNIVNKLNAQCVRFGFSDYQIKNAIDSESVDALSKIKKLDQAGVEIITYLKWPEDNSNNSIGPDPERIPVGKDREEVFEYLEQFLLNVGSYIDWIQISQEPLGATYYDVSTYSTDEVIEWWETVALFIHDMKTSHSDLSHLKIMTGGITGIKGQLDGTGNPTVAEAIDNIISFGEEYCDAIDIHLHTSSVELGTKEISWLKDRTTMPLTTTEWSQAHAVKEDTLADGWLGEINEVYGITNYMVIQNAYEDPMSPQEWMDLIATSPYTKGFISNFYAVLTENEFIHACYGSACQYGNPVFDWCQLIATKTTNPVSPNQPFYDEYGNLAGMLAIKDSR